MTNKILPTPERLRELLRYEPETGKLFWQPRPAEMFRPGNVTQEAFADRWNQRYAGKEAFTERHPGGYFKGKVFCKSLYAHRVIWAMINGEWPDQLIDHINGNGFDNRLHNLRHASAAENARNSRKLSKSGSGFKGIHLHRPTNKWLAQITVNRKKMHLGLYDSEIDAHSAYQKAAAMQHKDFANFG